MPNPVVQRSPDGWIAPVWKAVWYLLTSIPIGEEYRKTLQLRHAINLSKGLTFPVMFLLILWYNRLTTVTAAYAAIHGSYGVLWLVKEELYRDASWETPCTLGSAVTLVIGMSIMFWTSPYLLITGGEGVEPGPIQLCFILTLFIFGNWLHHSSDVQKYFVLQAKRGLITNGLFSRCRNPNYLGEMMIYGSFAGFSINHELYWVPWIYLFIIWSGLFLPSWLAKDKSMSRYKEWSEYTSRSGLILPWPFSVKSNA
ncbi:uncharacterized protein LOC111703215 [Eurytemora carolleeae]|uniref:uncharacterized protein LOC111703215 n=1 Tax=Eurytemora carolleeae TaxID=1294199 RepID=UPI000C765326|nr:uncharacterized protein LOC111703215 [Eurytemora carolleeae]|eukprot:XP_023330866.1 uncharacterized protein LOC111703215 [Eurytemora affinis]